MEPTVGGLIFRDLRHEQRRVAALIPINRVEPLQPVKSSRHSLLPIPLAYPCSHLDPDGTCRDPAHLFLHQRQQLKPSDLLDKLREGFTYIKDKNNQLFKPGAPSPLRGWTGEKRTKFDLPLTSRTGFHEAIIEGQGQGQEGSKTWRGPDIENESEESDSEEESSAEDEDQLHIKIPTEKDHRKGARRLKGKNEAKSKKRAVKKVQQLANEFYQEQDGRSGGKRQNGGVGEQSSDKQYDRELSHDWHDRTDDDTADPLLFYNHGNAPNPVGRDYMAMLENGQIDGQSTQQPKLFEKRRKEPKYDSVVDNFMKERSGSFHRQSLSRRNTFEAEGGLIRVTSFVSEPSFCHCSSPSYVARRENSREFHECVHCGKKTRLQTGSSGSFLRGSSGDMDRESSGEFVRRRSDSGDFVRTKSPLVESRSPSPELADQPKKKGPKKSRKSRRKISKAGDAKDPDYMDKLRQKLEEGKYQVDLEDLPSLDDINQRLRLDAPEEEPVEEDHYERQYKPPPIKYDQYREAYIKALSVVRGRLLPSESWMMEMNTTRSFVFSYFYSGYPRPRAVPGARNALPLPDKPPKTKKGAEMKMIFGKENVDDYLPGGPKNPHPGQFAAQKRLGGASIDKKKRKKKVKI